MIVNLVIIVFVLGMAVMWSTYGLFSALLHLLSVIVAGALAFAFWELWVDKLLIGFMPSYAWGVGLLLPFAVILIVVRLSLDNFVGGNMQFPRLVNQAVGGVVGACSGILTAGIALLGVSFLPLPDAVAGYRPYEVNSVGEVVPVEGGALWLGVDQMTANFYNRLSGGAFSTSTPLSHYQPDIARASNVHRLAKWYDPNQSLVVSPDTVSVSDEGLVVFREERIPGVGGDVNEYLTGWRNRTGGPGKLVLVQTNWKKGGDAATFDGDNILRVPGTQVRLLVDTGAGPWASIAPVGFSRTNQDGVMQFYRLDNNKIFASSAGFPEIDLHWVFAVASNAQPNYIMLRNSRFALPEARDLEGRDIAPLIGTMYDPDAPNAVAVNLPASDGNITSDPVGYATHKIIEIEATNDLPKKVSKNQAQALRFSDEEGDAEVLGGSGTVGDRAGGRGNSVDRVAVSSSLSALRAQIVPFSPDNTGVAQGNVQPIRFVDKAGREYPPFGYALVMGDGRMKIRVESSGDLRNNTDLPINELKSGEKLYAYWAVPRGITLATYNVGAATQEINFRAP
ncbi:MAG: CvpA family protein [Planctomycetota bacterium]